MVFAFKKCNGAICAQVTTGKNYVYFFLLCIRTKMMSWHKKDKYCCCRIVIWSHMTQCQSLQLQGFTSVPLQRNSALTAAIQKVQNEAK